MPLRERWCMMGFKPKFVVCPDCEGEGSFGPGFVWTQDEYEQEDPEEFEEMQRQLRNGVFDTPCTFCKGKRVVTPAKAEEWEEELAYRAEVRAEQRYMGVYA